MRLRPIGSRRLKATGPKNVRYHVVNMPPVVRVPAPVPWDELTRDENGRVVIDEKLILKP